MGCKLSSRTKAELEWAEVANLSLLGKQEQALPRYKAVKEVLGKDRYFLYNYSAELFQAGRYKEGVVMANECRKVWADYDVELLLGELYTELKQVEKAERHYRLASFMCPARFVPLYKLYSLYKERGDTAKAKILAQRIIDKPVKVESVTVMQVKHEMKKELKFFH